MRLLADENVPLPCIGALRADGHDVAAVTEDAPGAPDADVMARARREGRVLLTLDRDFGELLFRQGGAAAPPGVVYFRDVPPNPGHVAAVLRDLAARPELEIAGRFTVVSARAVRQRPMPG